LSAKALSQECAPPTNRHWPTTTTLVTGVLARTHGVAGNTLSTALRARRSPHLDPDLDKDEIVKAPTVYDLAKAAGLKNSRRPLARHTHAHSLDWAVPTVNKQNCSPVQHPAVLEEAKAPASIS